MPADCPPWPNGAERDLPFAFVGSEDDKFLVIDYFRSGGHGTNIEVRAAYSG